MDTNIRTLNDNFYQELVKLMENGEDMSVRQIYSLFPEINPNTLLWRLHKLVQRGKLHRTGQGYYSLVSKDGSDPAGYDYMQQKSKAVYDIAAEHGYSFYITGLDSLVGEMLHIPEKYPVLIVVEDNGIIEIHNALSERDLLVFTENDRSIVGNNTIRSKADVFILRGKDFSLAVEQIAQKEKGFIDLYYAVTRMEYVVSVPELSRIYQNLQRNKSLAELKVKRAAKDRGLSTEINWLLDISKTADKAREFMMYQIKESK